MGFIIRPAKGNLTMRAKVSAAGELPPAIERDAAGMVSMTGGEDGSQICYTLNGKKKTYIYKSPFALREGGRVTAWHKGNERLKVTADFERIENIPVKVVYASSEEHGEGDAAHIADGDNGTYWHTAYSVTVAQYPHWIDFDCSETKMIKGFTYLPRQDNRNGNIKTYRVQVSDDGKNWGEPVAEGTFEDGFKEKRVMFDSPVRARYVRFTALSSQDGQDFATGAEIKILD